MDQFKQKNKLIFSVIFFLVAVSLYVFLYHGIYKSQKVFEDARSAWQREEDRLAEIRMIDRSIKDVLKEKEEFESHFVHKNEIVPFLDSLESMATSVGAKIEVTSVDTASVNNTLDLNLQANGNFDSLYKLLTLIENSHYELEIVNYSMSRETFGLLAPGQIPKWRSSMSLRLLSYIR